MSTRSTQSSPIHTPRLKRTLSEQWDHLYPSAYSSRVGYSHHKKAHWLRILSSVSAFIKLFESLFWLSLLLEATHNEDDNSTPTLTVFLATAFVVSIITGLVAMFGPCFHGQIHYKVLAMTTLVNFVWDVIALILCFTLKYYTYPGNKDNQTETAFNATIGLITAGSIMVTTKKLLVEEQRHKRWIRTRHQQSTKSRFSANV